MTLTTFILTIFLTFTVLLSEIHMNFITLCWTYF